MTPRSLFNVILKILGIFFIKDFLESMSQLFAVFSLTEKPGAMPEVLWILAATIGILLAELFFCWLLVFKTDWIIKVLKLERGFNQETIPLNMHHSTILSISIIVIGGWLVSNEIPNFCRQLFVYFQEKRMPYGQTNPKIQYSVVSGVKIVIGILLIAEQRLFVNLIERQRKK
jgi:hypothetical protein